MQIHTLKVTKKPERKRIGRGGKRGTTSGRGTKGQGAHGKKKDPLFEGGRSTFTERLKKVRGFKSVHPKKYTVTLDQLEARFSDGETVTLATLIEKRVVPKKALVAGAKIVATGTLKKKLGLDESVACSEKAKEAFKK